MYGAPPATAALGVTAAWLTATPPATTPATTVATAPASRTVRRLMDPPFPSPGKAGSDRPGGEGLTNRYGARFCPKEGMLGRLPDRFLSISLKIGTTSRRLLPQGPAEATTSGKLWRSRGQRTA